MNKIISIQTLAIAIIIAAIVPLAGCPAASFDRDTFNTLAVSNSVLETAQADYESGKLPHDVCVYNLINKGKDAQGVAETAFLRYYQVEEAKGNTADLEQAVVNDLSMLAPFVAEIKTAYSSPATCVTPSGTTISSTAMSGLGDK